MLKLYKQGERCWGLLYETPEIIELRNSFMLCELHRVNCMKNFLRAFPVFVEHITEKQDWTNEELKAEPYFDYLINAHRRGDAKMYSRALLLKVLGRMRTAIALYWDIRDYGIKAPLDMYRSGFHPERLVLSRGNRCLEIMRQLGYENIICRYFETREIYTQNLAPSVEWGPLKGTR